MLTLKNLSRSQWQIANSFGGHLSVATERIATSPAYLPGLVADDVLRQSTHRGRLTP